MIRLISPPWLSIGALLFVVTLAPVAHAAWIPNGNPVCMASGTQIVTAVVPDAAGGVYVAWLEDGFMSSVHLQHVAGDGEVAPGWPVDGMLLNSVGTRSGYQSSLAPDGTGGVFVTWIDESSEFTNEYTNLYLQRFDSNGARHSGWAAGGVYIGRGSFDGLMRTGYGLSVNGIGSDATGRCTLVYALTAFGCHDGFCLSGTSLYSKCVDGSGTVLSNLSLDYCDTSGLNGPMLPDGGTGAFAAVYDFCRGGYVFVHGTGGGVTIAPIGTRSLLPDGANGIYARASRATGLRLLRLTPSGTPAPGWSADGVGLPAGDLEITDGSLGAIVCWSLRPGGVRALRVSSDGTIPAPWPAEGAVLASAPADPARLAAVPDGSGGLIAVWSDERLGFDNPDLYATCARSDGTLEIGVPASGFPLCTAPGRQDSPLLAATAPGSAIAVWNDYRDGAYPNIYAQQLRLDQAVPTQVSVVSAEAVAGTARLAWQLGAGALRATLQRRTEETDWVDLTSLDADGTGRITYEDRSVFAGGRFGYRLGLGESEHLGEAWVTLPRALLALRGFLPNPASGRVVIGLSLGSAAPATLDVLDVTGRRVLTRDLSDFGIGSHEVQLNGVRPLAPGLYLVRLHQAGEVRAARGLVLR